MNRMQRLGWVAAIAVAGALVACGPGEDTDEGDVVEETVPAEEPAPTSDPITEKPVKEDAEPEPGKGGVVEVVAREYAFEAPDSVPSGWTTFRLKNEGRQTHFLLIYHLPEGKSQADIQQEIVPVYDRVMEALQNGEMDKAGAMEELGNSLPPWFFSVGFRGGPGLVAPGGVSRATVNLDTPGTYLMECYVKGPDGRFHSSMGMQKQFTVTEGNNGAAEPGSDVLLTLSNAGIQTEGELSPGTHTIRVNFDEDPAGGFPYDVHLVRLTDQTDIGALKSWMDWMNVGGLRAPAPAEFLGGIEQMAAGSHAYFTVALEPGRYAWISEVGAMDAMYSEFTVE